MVMSLPASRSRIAAVCPERVRCHVLGPERRTGAARLSHVVRDAALDGVAAEASSGAGGKQRVGCSALSLGNPVPHHVAGERQEWCPPLLLGRSSAIAVTPAGPEWESDDEISQKITSTPRGVGTRVRHRVRPGPPIVAECVGYERRLSWSLVGNSSALRAGGGRVLLRLAFRPAAS